MNNSDGEFHGDQQGQASNKQGSSMPKGSQPMPQLNDSQYQGSNNRTSGQPQGYGTGTSQQPYQGQYSQQGQPYVQQPYAQPQSAYGQQPQYGYGQPQQPYTQSYTSQPPYNGQPYNQQYMPRPGYAQPYPQKSKLAAGLLGIFLGCFGVHNFYLGHIGKAVAQLLLTLIGGLVFGLGAVAAAIWGLIEGILILTSSYGSPWHRDARGVELLD